MENYKLSTCLGHFWKMKLSSPEITTSIGEIEENTKQVSLDSIPDPILARIMSYTDFGTCLKVRVNKAMEQRVHSILSLDKISLTIYPRHYFFSVDRVLKFKKYYDDGTRILANALNRWSTNTPLREIEINVSDQTSRIHQNIRAAIYALCQFKSTQLSIRTEIVQMNSDSMPRRVGYMSVARRRLLSNPQICTLPQLDFSTLLIMAVNMSEVSINLFCSSLSGIDLSILWKTLVEGDNKLELFSARVSEGVKHDFIKACFDITIEEEKTDKDDTIMYKCDSSLPTRLFYSSSFDGPQNPIIFKKNLMTKLEEVKGGVLGISFKKITLEEKSNLLKDLHEIELFLPYTVMKNF